MRRPGLRARVSAGFAVGSLIVTAMMSLLSYQITERFLLHERERTAVRATNYDAAVVRAGLNAEDQRDYVAVLHSLDTGTKRRALILSNGAWYSRDADSGLPRTIPAELQAMIERGKPAVQRVATANGPALILGVPLDDHTGFYVVDSMAELDRSLQVFGLVLTLVAATTTALAAALGWYATRYVVRPLDAVTAAATGIAAGDFTTRLDPATEPDLAKLTTSFNTMVDQLSQRLERDRRFAADVSHELRSPLQTLAAAASVLHKRQSELDPRARQALQLITEEIARFQTLVTDLLELARSDQPPSLGPVDMAELARQACRSAGVSESVVTTDGTDPVWQVDRRRFTQVLVNLIDNASRHGGGLVSLHIGRTPTGRFLDLDDDGPGISPADRDAVFGRFVRGRTASARGGSDGTGLGLALVAQHVAAHHGTITIGDRPGGGARFHLELPEPTP